VSEATTQEEVNALREHNRERWLKMIQRGYVPADPTQVLAATIDALAAIALTDEQRVEFEMMVEKSMKGFLDAAEPQMEHLDAVKKLQVSQAERKSIILP
jgi:hypothetical protein